jgi:predicted transcriptional regulator
METKNIPNKHIMNPMRVQLLQIIASSKWEATITELMNKSGKKEENVRRAVDRFAEYQLIRYTERGEFVITDKGKTYLEEHDKN